MKLNNSEKDFCYYRNLHKEILVIENEFKKDKSFKVREKYSTYLNLFSKISNDLLDHFPITREGIEDKKNLAFPYEKDMEKDYSFYRDLYKDFSVIENKFKKDKTFKVKEKYSTYLNLFSKIPNRLLGCFPITREEIEDKKNLVSVIV